MGCPLAFTRASDKKIYRKISFSAGRKDMYGCDIIAVLIKRGSSLCGEISREERGLAE